MKGDTIAHDDASLTSNSAQGPAQSQAGGTGEDADALYARGMAHYRRRKWQEAKECFARLRAIAPDRRGVDALLDEVGMFIQLQAMQAGEEERVSVSAEAGAEEEQPASSSAQREAVPDGVRTRRVPWLALMAVLAVLAVILLLIPNEDEARVRETLNRCQSAMNARDYCEAAECLREALHLATDDESVKTEDEGAKWYQHLVRLWAQVARLVREALGLVPSVREIGVRYEKATLFCRLHTLCCEGVAEDIAADRLSPAIEKLDEVLDFGDPTRCSADEKKDLLERWRRLEERGDRSEICSILDQLRNLADCWSDRARHLLDELFDKLCEQPPSPPTETLTPTAAPTPTETVTPTTVPTPTETVTPTTVPTLTQTLTPAPPPTPTATATPVPPKPKPATPTPKPPTPTPDHS